MGIVVNKTDDKNQELTDRINADLRAKATESANIAGKGEVDLEEDSAYLSNYKKTGRFSWVWIVLIVLAIVSLIIIFNP